MAELMPFGRREEVWMRDAGRCQWCGDEGTDVHHRVRRRDGGHGLFNLVLVDRACHDHLHRHPEEAMRRGFILSFTTDPADVGMIPWTDWKGRAVFPTPPPVPPPSTTAKPR